MKEKVMLVEDDDTLCELSQEMFRLLNVPLFVAQTYEEANDLFNTNHDDIRVVIFDMNLDNYTGVDTYKSLCEIDSQFIAILASGMFLDDDIDTYKEMGFHEVISKPYNLKDVRRIIAQYMSNQE